MSDSNGKATEQNWQPQPGAAKLVREAVERFCELLPELQSFRQNLKTETGTRLVDWVDRVTISDETKITRDSFSESGFCPVAATNETTSRILQHPGAILPNVCIDETQKQSLAIAVDSVNDFLLAQGLHSRDIQIVGEPNASLRRAIAWQNEQAECWVVERRGNRGWAADSDSPNSEKILAHYNALANRPRSDGFAATRDLIENAISDLGLDRVCDLFFQTEREYWQSRNNAARVQKQRQDALGVGWANHDHHTYRSSRESFAELISILKLLGFHCRERFYAGEQAGWGAQVLEQSICGIVIFADVDLLPGEVEGDFASEGLPPSNELGTVGLWCKLHGEAFLEAGMHHLECQFDFDAAREQLAACGIESMKPFTDLPHLKQAFTKPEIWCVDESRIAAALDAGWIDVEQANKFRNKGALGSHLEILERNDGYKGFNQTGISHIIKETDPRK